MSQEPPQKPQEVRMIWDHPLPDTVWPSVETAGDLEHVLRYGKNWECLIADLNEGKLAELTRGEQLVLASICAAYRNLRKHPLAYSRQKNRGKNLKLQIVIEKFTKVLKEGK